MALQRQWWRQLVSVALLVILTIGVSWPTGGSLAQEGGELNQNPATPTALGPAIPPEVSENADDWPVAQGNLAAHRAAAGSPIDSSNVDQLEVAWRFPIEATNPFGAITSTPVVIGDVVYIQDMLNNVFALDRATGDVIWETEFNIPTEGPNGIAVAYGMVYGGLGDAREAFALDAETGEEVWRVQLSNNDNEGIDMTPAVYDNVVYISTVPGNEQGFYQGGGKGILYALDAANGTTLWQWDTTTDNLWSNARLNSGGGLWYPPSVDEEGNIYFGTGNAAPWPGTPDCPNASCRPGDNDYASSMVSLDPTTGSLRWYHNAKPHDLFDHDFQLTPVIATLDIDGVPTKIAIGAGKTGTVVAANADTGEILWEVEVGEHNEFDEVQEIPEGETIEVLPGVIGGVETSMAYADGTVFVPVVNLATEFTSTEFVAESFDLTQGTGELLALNAVDGSVKWQVDIPSMVLASATVANDVVFTGALDGVFRAYDTETGGELWTYQAGAGLNAPPAIAGDLVILPAGGPLVPAGAADEEAEAEATPEGAVGAEPEEAANPEAANEVIAFRLGGGAGGDAADSDATPAAPDASATEPAAVEDDDEVASPAPDASPSDDEAAGEVVTVNIASFAFNPKSLEIPVGTTVEFINQDGVVHTATHDAPEGERLFDSGDLARGETYRFTFDEPGTYPYFCIPHPFMRAEIVVT